MTHQSGVAPDRIKLYNSRKILSAHAKSASCGAGVESGRIVLPCGQPKGQKERSVEPDYKHVFCMSDAEIARQCISEANALPAAYQHYTLLYEHSNTLARRLSLIESKPTSNAQFD